MNLTDYPIIELEALLKAIEDQCMISVDNAMNLDKWYQRLKEALNEAYSESMDEFRENDEELNENWLGVWLFNN